MKIGPYLTVEDPEYVPNMQDAYESDTQCGGCHELNNELAKDINAIAPTILSMARLIEQERDALKLKVAELEKDLRTVKGEEPDAAQ